MAKSEIDDIFASKGKAKPIPAASTSSSLPKSEKSTKKDKKRKRKNDEQSSSNVDKPPSKKTSAVAETVIDPSVSVPSAKRAKVAKGSSETKAKAKSENSKTAKADEAMFKDSRGSGPRRKTDEGFAIYKVDELGIGDEGGDTPLCPFDCQCCF